MDIGSNIKKFRKLKKLTQRELAEKINKSTITVRKYESNDINVPIDVLGEIATLLEVPIDLLIGSELIPIENSSGFGGFIDSQFGYFDPELEGYLDFLERKLSAFKSYKKDNMFVSNCVPSFSSELVSCIDNSISSTSTPLSVDKLKQFIFDNTGIEDIWNICPEKELSLNDLISLLSFYKKAYFNDFCEFINSCSFGFSDLDESIKEIISDFKYSINKRVKTPGGFITKPNTITVESAYQSLVNLICYVNKSDILDNMNDDNYSTLLKKICDSLEFEIFKLEKDNLNNKNK